MDPVVNILFWGLFVGGGTIFIIFCIIKGFKDYKQNKAKQKAFGGNKDHAPVQPEYSTVTIKATVVDQLCGVKMIGIKTPKTVKEFIIVFQTENGEIIKLNVPEEMYDGFEQGQTGILSVVDGELYGFELVQDASS